MNRCPTIEALRAKARKGRCYLCDSKLPPRQPGVRGRHRERCGDEIEACRRKFRRLVAADRRAEANRFAALAYLSAAKATRAVDRAIQQLSKGEK